MEEAEPLGGGGRDAAGVEGGDSLAAEVEEVFKFEEGEAADAGGGGVRERVSVLAVLAQSLVQGREGDVVKAEGELRGVRGGLDFVEEDVEGGVGEGLKAEGGIAQFADSLPEGVGMFGAEVGVIAEGGFEFVAGFGG